MSDSLPLVLAVLVGVGLGLLFFGGLWLTMRWLPTTRWPLLLTLGSLLGRMLVTLGGFYLVMAGRWERLVACLCGFVAGRILVQVWTRLPPPDQPDSKDRTEPA